MNDEPLTLGSLIGVLITVFVLMAIIIHLGPLFLQTVWQLLPAVLILWLIVAVLRGIVRKLLE